ncbi:Aste57867_18327 [Aphanomyces stellatus]|uniref:Aste57867_18327 protein n=1 Tax=Aphanomyces stellatus TaxID=120398 RepID=A0A485KE66_9STRA|nr:hypothetical protein As57867_018265 [Aphanomyces stellatus]KAF0711097.1 hypothetical protein As57867_005383 [Aphanomyces stellatus]VFT82454.1 Aste57867_5396 [Aphanomyces stellatus]VFT95063.1 Aste57867_18327 [Aphanomyces stellatus]
MIVPFDAPTVTKPTKLSSAQRILVAAGLVYLFLTISCGMWYVSLLAPTLSNDFYWPHFNASGYQVFLMDLINVKLQTRVDAGGSVDVDLLAVDAITAKLYNTPDVQTEFEPNYARRVFFSEMTSLRQGVQAMRTTSIGYAAYIKAQYCWVDFQQRWDIAHTESRSARCRARYSHNAAIYLETLVRNFDWNRFVALNGAGWRTVIANALLETPDGARWLADRPSQSLQLDVDAEVRYLERQNLTAYTLFYDNAIDMGLTETIDVVNTLGFVQALSTKSMPLMRGPWTSWILFWDFNNDMLALEYYNASLVRGSAYYFANNEYALLGGMDYAATYGLCDRDGVYASQAWAFYNTVGPYGSIDTFYVSPPLSLVQLYQVFTPLLYEVVLHDVDVAATFQSLGDVEFVPWPPAFAANDTMVYFGGNVLCQYNGPTSYPQSQFRFTDDCSSQAPLTIPAASESMVFALVATAPPSIDSICALQTPSPCVATLTQLQPLAAKLIDNASTFWRVLVKQTMADLPPVRFIQYAQNAMSDWHLLQQPLLTTTDDNVGWSFYGWLALADWVNGAREVLQLDGDVSTLVFISDPSPKTTLVLSHLELSSTSGNQVVSGVVTYTSCVLVGIAALLVVYTTLERGHIRGRNLFQFNRVVGSVWIGRPLLLLRGLTAILMLSTSQILLRRVVGFFSTLAFAPRSVAATLVLVGESTWVSYALNDALLVVTGRRRTRYAAPLASSVAFLTTFGWSLLSPVQLSTTFDRTCTFVNLDHVANCEAGVVHVGDWHRFEGLVLVHVVAAVAAALVVTLACHRWTPHDVKAPLLVHGIADALFDLRHSDTVWQLDDATCVMTGLLPFTCRGVGYTLDVKLWVLIRNTDAAIIDRTLGTSTLLTPFFERPQASGRTMTKHAARPFRATVLVGLGLAYAVASAFGSVSFIAVSTVNFANNFYWATFNLTGHHAAMAEWTNEQVILGRRIGRFRFDEPRWSSMVNNYSDPTAPIYASPHIGSRFQFETFNSVSMAIQGIRNTDPCAVPWIFSQYCWVDFQRQWPMANSEVRQNRCLASDVSNGAVYLESVLRNTDWNTFTTCWGRAFELAVGHELNQTLVGQHWLAQIKSNVNSISDETTYWTNAGIDNYVVQWQSYKTTGLIHTYLIENAFGVQYPMTLSHLNGSYRIDSQTSYKMYWGWANDMWAIDHNSTLLSGQSLIRTSATFAFANQSILAVLVQNATLSLPLNIAHDAVQTQIGPFGSIDMKNVPCPNSAKAFIAMALDVTRSLTTVNATAASAHSNITTATFNLKPYPQRWHSKLNWLAFGGNILCHSSGGGGFYSTFMEFTGRIASCDVPMTAVLRPSAEMVIVAALGAQLSATSSHLALVCSYLVEGGVHECQTLYMGPAVAFVTQYVDNATLSSLHRLAADAAADISLQRVSLVQFVQENASQPLQLLPFELFDPSDSVYDTWSWLYVFEWALGTREVVAFEGDTGTIRVLTKATDPQMETVQPHELPTSIAIYMRSGLQYVTGVMLGVTTLVVVYIVLSRGAIEGWNTLELNRVAGIVWVGRPLLFLRGVTALALLSTATLEMQLEHGVSSFTVPIVPWYKTILSAGEATWLVYVLNDICMVWTEHWTSQYASPSSVLVWIVAAILTLARPVVHSVTIDPVCTIDQMDFQLVCSSGTVYIGQKERFYWLLGIIGLSNVAVYAAVHLTKNDSRGRHIESLLLTSGAKYLFDRSNWMHDDTYYMDPASALLNGLVTLRWRDAMLVMDVKLWRTFTIRLPPHKKERLPDHLVWALPLTE